MSVKIHINKSVLNQVSIVLMLEIILLRDICFKKNTIDTRYFSAWPQGMLGTYLIERGQLLTDYSRSYDTFTPEERKDRIKHIYEIDNEINKYVKFDIHKSTAYTISMIDSIIQQDYVKSLRSLKGFIYSIQ